MRRTDMTIATMTLARDPAEAERLLVSLRALSGVHLPVDVTDGGSIAGFVDEAAAIPEVVVHALEEDRGLVPQVRASLTRAASRGRPFVLYTEPDKREFFEAHLDMFLASAPSADDIGLVIASRTERAFATFPDPQQHTERIFNRLCGVVLQAPGDYTYGPFLVRGALIGHLRDVDASLGWGWRPYLFWRARQAGSRLVSVAGDYQCPAHQRDESDLAYRVRQLAQNVDGLISAANHGFFA